jgi:hypothetical protein
VVADRRRSKDGAATAEMSVLWLRWEKLWGRPRREGRSSGRGRAGEISWWLVRAGDAWFLRPRERNRRNSGMGAGSDPTRIGSGESILVPP